MGGQNPQSIAFCPIADRHGAPKDTLRNIIETGEFVITGFTRAPSVHVLPPRVEEAPTSSLPGRTNRSGMATIHMM